MAKPTTKKAGKTVYILGAGFTKAFGGPLQGELISFIQNLSTYSRNPNSSQQRKINKWLESFYKILNDVFKISPDKYSEVDLEDLLTVIDRCINTGAPLKNYNYVKLKEVRDNLYSLIRLAMRKNLSITQHDTLSRFSSYVIDKCQLRIKDEKIDQVSIITTNWDIKLDNDIYKKLSLLKKNNEDFFGVVDYCCYVSSRDENDKTIKPGLYALGKGKFNVKILKLHGSMNWLKCPMCNRLYIKLFKNNFQAGWVFASFQCRHCNNNPDHKNNKKSTLLQPSMVMPTFLKDISNFQLQLVWQNAAVELAEAEKIVFMGYSLPMADFEFKQLMSRMIRKNAKIEVVLHETDNPDKFEEEKYSLLNINEKKSLKRQTAGYRYGVFFSGRRLKIHYNGVSRYIQDYITNGTN